MHERVAEPEPPLMLLFDREHERLVELAVTVRATCPVKPFRGAIVMVETPPAPTLTVKLAGPAEIAKSGDDDGDTET
jgi:hypothetical protein